MSTIQFNAKAANAQDEVRMQYDIALHGGLVKAIRAKQQVAQVSTFARDIRAGVVFGAVVFLGLCVAFAFHII